ncbi:MAG TPA: TetR family transcriptional regulator [Solirubrobacterales bacterium]|nr:TetR family transcriptional regulator [Solirubrobacterales bacterium]
MALAKTKTPRTGRRRGVSSSQEQILEAARELFLQRGYEGATLRAIAKKAGVDASLIVHFFGNKVGLFAAAIEWPHDPDVEIPKLLRDGRGRVGHNLVGLLVGTWDREGGRNPILTMIRASMAEPEIADLLRNFLRERLYAPLFEALGSDRPDLRSNLLATQMIGLGMIRYVQRFEPLASANPADVIAWVGPSAQRYLTGKLD